MREPTVTARHAMSIRSCCQPPVGSADLGADDLQFYGITDSWHVRSGKHPGLHHGTVSEANVQKDVVAVVGHVSHLCTGPGAGLGPDVLRSQQE